MPKVSVIITTIGRETLQKAIEAVEKQTYKDYELIVIDGRKDKNGAKSLNIGLSRAKGEYIAILDDDDEWVSKDKLEKQVRFLENNKDYIAVGCETEGCKVPGKLSLEGMPFAHSSIIFRNNGILYDERFKRGKDLDIMIRLSKVGKIGIIRDCFIKYTIRKGNPNDLRKKITDCSWHRKVIWKHRKDYPWVAVYWRVLKRQIRLLYYEQIKNKIKNIIVNSKLPR